MTYMVIVMRRWGQDVFQSENEIGVVVTERDVLKVTMKEQIKVYSPGNWRTVTSKSVPSRAKV